MTNKMPVVGFGVSELDIKASREYQKIYGKFHPLSNVYSNFRTAREWYDQKGELNHTIDIEGLKKQLNHIITKSTL